MMSSYRNSAGKTEWCRGCRRWLSVPRYAQTIRCGICGTLTPVGGSQQGNQYGHMNGGYPSSSSSSSSASAIFKASGKSWMKGFLSLISGNNPTTAETNHYYAAQGTTITRPPMLGLVSGKKRALLVGVSYRGKRYELKGTVNDVQCMKHLLTKNGFPESSILVLTEEERDYRRRPTRQNMFNALHWLVRDCKKGDSLLFHFSGHGSQQVDTNGDERDGFDETLCPVDYEDNGMIVDDDINEILVRPLLDGVKLHAIIDACHSGTVLDLPYLCRMNSMGTYNWEDHLPPRGVLKGTKGGMAISFSGCDDHQTSADTSALAGDTITGAMTFCFIQAVESEPATTYGRLLVAMRNAIRNADTAGAICLNGPLASLFKRVFQIGLTQEPQLCSSEKFDVYKKPFIL